MTFSSSPILAGATEQTPSPLAQRAIDALARAATAPPDDKTLAIEERSVWEPTSWLTQCCWQALADRSAGDETVVVAALAAYHHPLASFQALYRLAQHAAGQPALVALVRGELAALKNQLVGPVTTGDDNGVERLLLAAASAARVDDLPLACLCLERIDQSVIAWSRIMAKPEWRTLLAQSVAHMGLQPQTEHLVAGAVRRFDDAGVQFLHQIAALVAPELKGNEPSSVAMDLLASCMETLRYAPLTSVQSRRLAVAVLAQAGLIEDVLAQLTTISNLLAARRESGLTRQSEATLLRQVKRPKANPDIDFQVYTMQEAVAAMPLAQITREHRMALAKQLAWLGVRSDGWTAAGAATALIELGAIQYAVEVIHHIAPNDPTRSEGTLALVRGLLAIGESQLAAEQIDKALAWANLQEGRNPERALIWGLADIYLNAHEPEKALQLLDRWRTPELSFLQQLRTWRGKPLDDDTLRNQSLRLQALLQLNRAPKEVQAIFAELSTWAPRLLDGEALINFTVQGLLQPLLAAGKYQPAWTLLPDLQTVLSKLNGHKHAVRVAEVATLLAQQLTAHPALQNDGEVRKVLETFLVTLWQAGARRGIWQTVHSIEGTLPLLIALEGPQAAVAIAHASADEA